MQFLFIYNVLGNKNICQILDILFIFMSRVEQSLHQ